MAGPLVGGALHEWLEIGLAGRYYNARHVSKRIFRYGRDPLWTRSDPMQSELRVRSASSTHDPANRQSHVSDASPTPGYNVRVLLRLRHGYEHTRRQARWCACG
jgi:hypothetical protein